MRVVATIAQVLLGLMFLFFGLNGFLFFLPAPHLSGLVAEFNDAIFRSHYMWFTMGAQVVAGILLLVNRLVVFAMIVLAAILSNILVFHITMWPAGLPLPIFATLLWIIVAFSYRSKLLPLLAVQVARD